MYVPAWICLTWLLTTVYIELPMCMRRVCHVYTMLAVWFAMNITFSCIYCIYITYVLCCAFLHCTCRKVEEIRETKLWPVPNNYSIGWCNLYILFCVDKSQWIHLTYKWNPGRQHSIHPHGLSTCCKQYSFSNPSTFLGWCGYKRERESGLQSC